MAAGRHNLTRRALLGVGAVLPAFAAGRGRRLGALPCAWSRALHHFRRSEARLAAFSAAALSLPAERRAYPACRALEDRFDTLESARLHALTRLLAAPAPGLAALSLKIDLMVDDQAWELTAAQAILAALKADARRLCHGGR
ncbi:MAG TPA: hypothetical protein VF680_07730 [Allosphingosinicella sp.]